VRLGDSKPGAVELGAAGGRSRDRQPVPAEASYQARRVALTASLSGALACALIWASRAGLPARNSSIGLASLAALQGYTPQRDCSHGSTRHASAHGCGPEVQRHIGDAAIGTVPSEFLENVFLDLVTGERSLLILDA
jgi:hypothetical protein